MQAKLIGVVILAAALTGCATLESLRGLVQAPRFANRSRITSRGRSA